MAIIKYCLLLMTAFSLSLSPVSPLYAQETDGETAPAAAIENERWSFLITYGEEDCPEAQEGEILVCAERPESERYRIPSTVYKKPELPHTGDQSLTAANETLEGFARLSRPNSCSVVGSNGWTGCQAAALRQWFAEKREDGVR